MNWGSPKIQQNWEFNRTAKDGFSNDGGVLRRVWFGALYLGPPPANLSLRTWEKDPKDPTNDLAYYMSLGDIVEPPQVVSLMELAEKVRKKAGLRPKKPKHNDSQTMGIPNPDAEQLDRCVDRLLEIGALLHSSRMGLGSVHPENVLLVKSRSLDELVLPDWGFAHDEPNNGPKGLEFLSDDAWRSIRKDDISVVNRRFKEQDRDQIIADIQALGRILEAVLLGKQAFLSGSTLARHAPNPRKSLQRRFEKLPSYEASQELRDTIRTAIDNPERIGQINTLRDRLNAHPVSRFFEFQAECSQEARLARRQKVKFLSGSLLVTLLMATGVTGYLYQQHIIDPWPPSPPPICPDCYGRTNLTDLLIQFQTAHQDVEKLAKDPVTDAQKVGTALDREYQLLKQAHDTSLLSTYESRRDSELVCLAILRNHYVEDLGLLWSDIKKEWIDLKTQLDNLAGDGRQECEQLNGVLIRVKRVEDFINQAKSLGEVEEQPRPDWLKQFDSYMQNYCGTNP